MLTLLPALLVICRPVDLLAARARRSASPEPTATGFWARGRRAASRRAPAHGLGRHRAGPRRRCARHLAAQRDRAAPTRSPSTARPTRSSGEQVLAAHFPAGDRRRRSWCSPTPTRRRGRRPRSRRSTGIEPSVAAAGDHGRPVASSRRTLDRSRRTATAAYDTVDRVRDARARGARRRRDGRRRHRDRPRHPAASHRRQPGDHPARRWSSCCSSWCCCCARSSAPLILIATVVLSFGAALGLSALRLPSTSSASPARTPSLPAVRLRLPRRARHRLQHLPDDPGPRGGRDASAPGGARWSGWPRPAA